MRASPRFSLNDERVDSFPVYVRNDQMDFPNFWKWFWHNGAVGWSCYNLIPLAINTSHVVPSLQRPYPSRPTHHHAAPHSFSFHFQLHKTHEPWYAVNSNCMRVCVIQSTLGIGHWPMVSASQWALMGPGCWGYPYLTMSSTRCQCHKSQMSGTDRWSNPYINPSKSFCFRARGPP